MHEHSKQAENFIEEGRILIQYSSEEIDEITTDVEVDLRIQVTVEDLFDCG